MNVRYSHCQSAVLALLWLNPGSPSVCLQPCLKLLPLQVNGTVLAPAALCLCRHLLPHCRLLCLAGCAVCLAARFCASPHRLCVRLMLLQQGLHCLAAGCCLLLALGSSGGGGLSTLAGMVITCAS